MRQDSSDYVLSIFSVEVMPGRQGEFGLVLKTNRGDLSGIFHPCEGEEGAVIWVSGAGGGFVGPANDVYADLARDLVAEGISSLRLAYRQPSVFSECVLDVLGGISFIKGLGGTKVALVGHSFGGAVAIQAGVLSPMVVAVVASASQLAGAERVSELSPKALLVDHGNADVIVAPANSEWLYEMAKEPKELHWFDGAGHGLNTCRDEVYDLWKGFLLKWVGPTSGKGSPPD